MIALETGAEWCFIYWGASFLGAQGGLSKADAASVMSAYFVAMLLGRVVGSGLSRRFDGQTLVLIALACAVVGFPIVWLAPGSIVRVIGLFIVGLGLANVYPLSLALATGSAPEQADRALARLAIGCGSAILIAPFLVGALADHLGIGRAFGVALPLLLASLALAVLLRWTSPAHPRHARR